MPAPAVATWAVDVLIAAHTAFRDIIDTGAGVGSIKVRDAADVLLGTQPLLDPCGTINGTTGQFTFALGARDESADANGIAAYAEVCDVAGAVKLSLPTQAGTTAVSGKFVMNTLTVVAGAPLEILSGTIG